MLLHHSRCGLPRLYQRNAIVLGSLNGLCSLGKLDLSCSGLREGDLPNDIGCLSYLKELELSGNNFVSLPASIGCLSKLKLFRVNGCQKLQQLPDLSKLISLVNIDIAGCTSLKICANCFVLVDNEGCDSILLKMLQRYLQLIPRPYFQYQFEIVTPGREIPEWFSNQSLGDSLTVELPLDSCTTWMGIALCAVFEVQDVLSKFHCFQLSCSQQGMWPFGFSRYFKMGDVVSDHLWAIYVSCEKFMKKCGQIKVLLRADYFNKEIRILKKSCPIVKKCAFRLVHEQDVEQLNQIMMNKSIINSTTTCPTKSADAQGQQRHDDQEASPSGSGSSHQKSPFRNTHALSEEADQNELNDDDDDVVDEARPRKRKKIDVFGTDL
ncbi:unnamed protein product [Prunus armeniaca]